MNKYSPYAVIYANEEETSFRHVDKNGGKSLNPNELLRAVRAYRKSMPDYYWSELGCDSTGGRVYIDGEHIEFSTPEYATIADVAARIQSNEASSLKVAESFLKRAKEPILLGINRRVVDGYGNTIGCHDNFGFVDPDGPSLLQRARPFYLRILARGRL
ncbi:MAG TPA: proteasome accessory factor PafA2 family protein [Candidatus Saccharimonadales bacterium]|nr:proteasome accessory factor PafA2 family protein [Candidatus Saccharimonadales bacterium]